MTVQKIISDNRYNHFQLEISLQENDQKLILIKERLRIMKERNASENEKQDLNDSVQKKVYPDTEQWSCKPQLDRDEEYQQDYKPERRFHQNLPSDTLVCDPEKMVTQIPSLVPVNKSVNLKMSQNIYYKYKPFNYIKTTIREKIPENMGNPISHDEFNKLSSKYMTVVKRAISRASHPS